MLTIVVWKWKGPDTTRIFRPEYVNKLMRLFKQYCQLEHRFVCMTDDPGGLECEHYPLPVSFAGVDAPQGRAYPQCYNRLWLFSAEAAERFPGQVVCMDVDAVICGDVTKLFDRQEDFVAWHDSDHRGIQYSGGLWMLRTGTRLKVWDDFDIQQSPRITRKAGLIGSDQAWISYCLYPNEVYWTRKDGIYRTRNLHPGDNPNILQTPSMQKPWTKAFQLRYPKFAKIWNDA